MTSTAFVEDSKWMVTVDGMPMIFSYKVASADREIRRLRRLGHEVSDPFPAGVLRPLPATHLGVREGDTYVPLCGQGQGDLQGLDWERLPVEGGAVVDCFLCTKAAKKIPDGEQATMDVAPVRRPTHRTASMNEYTIQEWKDRFGERIAEALRGEEK